MLSCCATMTKHAKRWGRRDAIRGIGLLATSASLYGLGCTRQLGPPKGSAASRSLDGLSVRPLTERDLAHVSRLTRTIRVKSSDALDGDGLVAARINRILKSALLAGKEHDLSGDVHLIQQLPQVRFDTTGYRATIRSGPVLSRVLTEAMNVSESVREAFPDLKATKPAFGSFFWVRQVRPTHLGSKADTAFHGTTMRLPVWNVEELYWMDVWVNEGDMAFPRLRVFWDSLGLRDLFSGRSEDDLLSVGKGLPDRPFLDHDKPVVNWHDLAEMLDLTDHLFYIRACFASANPGASAHDVAYKESRSRVTKEGHAQEYFYFWNAGAHHPHNASEAAAVFVSTNDPQQRTRQTYVRDRVWENDPSWATGKEPPQLPPIAQRRNEELARSRFRVEKLYKLTRYLPQVMANGWEVSGEVPLSAVPRPVAFDEQAGRWFKELVEDIYGAVYLGAGRFEVSLQGDALPAAVHRYRGSSWGPPPRAQANPVVSVFKGTAKKSATQGAVGIVSGLAALGMAALGDLWASGNVSDAYEKATATGGVAGLCAENAKGTANPSQNCRDCVQDVGPLNPKPELQSALAKQIVTNAAGVAVGAAAGVATVAVVCTVGVLFSIVTFGASIGACVVAAAAGAAVAGGVAGLGVGIAETVSDVSAYKDMVNETDEIAFGPCDRLKEGGGISIDEEGIIIGN